MEILFAVLASVYFVVIIFLSWNLAGYLAEFF